MSDVVKALLDNGMVEIKSLEQLQAANPKDLAAFAMYIPRCDKVWINSTRRLRDLTARFFSWRKGQGQTLMWAHQVHAELGRSRNIRLFYDPHRFVSEAWDACNALGALIPRKPLPEHQTVRIFLVTQIGTPYYRLLSDQGNRVTRSILAAWLAQARLQIGATHRVVDPKIREWANANQAALRDPHQFSIQEIASFDHSHEAVGYMRDFADERGREHCLNVIFRVR